MRLVFLGSGAFGLPTLEHLAQHHGVCAVVTQPDKPAGRKRALTPTPIGAWAGEHLPSTPLLKPTDINEPAVRDEVRAFDADAWVILAFGQKLSVALIEGIFAINLHASLLPRWRGAAPIHRAVEAGDAVTGNSVITIAQRMDAGAVLGRSERPIRPEATTGELHDLLAQDGPALIERVLRQHAEGTLVHEEQDESLVKRARKMTKAEGTTDFSLPAEACRAKIHAFNPWPSVTVMLDGYALKLHRAKATGAHTDQDPGTIIDAHSGRVACAGGTVLELVEVQPANKPAMAWEAFANGHDVSTGDRLTPRAD